MKKFNNFITEHLKSDAIGYNIGKYIYHATPSRNLNTILEIGFIPQDGISIDHKEFENRLYFATSLISAYDITVNFESWKNEDEYIIFKLSSDCLKDYEEDSLFVHGIYVDYPIDKKYIVEYMDSSDLFNKFDDDDIEDLY